MKDIPRNIQELLDFANLGCTPGEPNPQRFKSYHTDSFFEQYVTNEHIPKLKRPPNPSQPFPEGSKETLFTLSLFKTYNGHVMSKAKTGEFVYHGKDELCPTTKEFKDFFSKNQIEFDDYTELYIEFENCWYTSLAAFYRAIEGDDNNILSPYIHFLFHYTKGRNPLDDYHKLRECVSSHIKDLFFNRRALHSLLRQCPCCGSFFIVKEKKKPKKYCDDKCKAFFKPPSRQDDREAKKVTREEKKDNLKESDLSVIQEKYKVKINGKYRKVLDKNEAERIYNKLSKKAKKELKSLETIETFILG